MLIIQQLETRIGEQSEAMVVTADKEYRIYVVAYAFVIIFNFCLLLSENCPLTIILATTGILLVFWIQFCILVGRQLIFEQSGCTIKFLFFSKHYDWSAIKAIKAEDYTKMLKSRLLYKKGVYFSINNVRKPKWMMPSDFSFFVNQFTFFFVYFDPGVNVSKWMMIDPDLYGVNEFIFLNYLRKWGIEVTELDHG